MAQPSSLPALTDLSVSGYQELLEVPGARSFTPGQVRRWVLERGAQSWETMTDVSKTLREELAQRWVVRKGKLERRHESKDGTVGLLTRLWDEQIIESVSIPEGSRHTLCISSQVGCAVGCCFCASGLDGLIRNLSQGEIIEQVLLAREQRPDMPLTNYVFMGSGEPTHNMTAVMDAIRLMNASDGLGIGARRITVSTVGHPAALARLAAEPIPFNIALSLHAPDDAWREELMPGLGKSHLAETLAAAKERFISHGRRLTVEVVVIAGKNDSPDTAQGFAELLEGYPAVVNLIPFNKVDGLDLDTPRNQDVDAMVDVLRKAGVTTTVRRPRGQDVGVACGQLRRRANSAHGSR
ncbi:MAG: 23S rRNA (adenine2503-C2)-methyltransferase [Pseudohongiellaceae bacterium]|jgi:23S rRNA (adenine2503-C2)-methyltransferase